MVPSKDRKQATLTTGDDLASAFDKSKRQEFVVLVLTAINGLSACVVDNCQSAVSACGNECVAIIVDDERGDVLVILGDFTDFVGLTLIPDLEKKKSVGGLVNLATF